MFERVLEALPSAEPDYRTDHGFLWLCPECGLPVHSDYHECLRCGWKMPSAESERKKGRWLTEVLDGIPGHRATIIYCSECCQAKPYRTKFCPNCGTDMREEG